MRLGTWALAKMFWMWDLTVERLMHSRRAIWSFVKPSAMSSATSRSRDVRAESSACCEKAG